MKETIFLTGGTGFLGSEIASRLVRQTDSDIYVLVRAENEEAAKARLHTAWQHDRKLAEFIGSRIFPVTGDITKAGLGIDPFRTEMLRRRVTLLFHCGANIGFQTDESELRRVNLEGTRNTLEFASSLERLERFVHISTAYVAGQRKGLILEDDLPGSSFSSLYEKSKADAEMLVRGSGLPFVICRPGMIVGDSKTGRVRDFNTIYYVLKLMLLGKLRVLPVRPDYGLNIVPVDYVADSAVAAAFSGEAEGKTFHLTCPENMQPKAGELAKYVRKWAKKNLGAGIPKPAFIPVRALEKAGLSYNRKAEGRKKSFTSNLLTLLPYFFGEQEFSRENTDRIIGEYTYDWREGLDALLDFACRKNFMRQGEGTVFEQARKRRASKRWPVTYHDVTSVGITDISGPEANERIEKIRCALWAAGVRKGDRVAVTGINSAEHMMIEHAVGLLGAVSVPLYYTTPPGEIGSLLSRSGAGWLFIGDMRIMERADEIDSDARFISFSAAERITKPGVTRWDDFLAMAAETPPAQHPLPDDLATIRYTSGTTGDAKGVTFTFAQLEWMGSVMTGLLPWKERNRSMRYLSFLPLSHVVEGILASNAPYYMIAKADFYYLNDFGALTDALPKVRPSVFFSVPRFYEKLWDTIAGTGAGKKWLSMKDGPARAALGITIKKAALRKAGLDGCSQLIAGSAPISRTLLRNFRKLGIEVHNAYGLTEAPLITINRKGNNVLGSVGTPLPETEVTVSPDGELLVRGPQVTPGYYGAAPGGGGDDTVSGGVLKTGDLGAVRGDGHVALRGRKKDILVTAYGKNISITKIEQRLKDIPGVSEAVLIGSGRPFVTALLWTEETGDADAGSAASSDAAIGEAVAEMNAGLSHPEQVKRFRVITEPLSIAAGELTPNLKVRRSVVEEHLKDVIGEMYSQGSEISEAEMNADRQ